MKVLHLNAGNETGGGMHYLLRTLSCLNEHYDDQFILGVMEKKTLYYRAKNIGIPVVCFESKYKYSFRTIVKIVKYINKEKITHVHTHGPRANVYMNMIRKYTKVKWIITIHSNPKLDFLKSSFRHRMYTYIHLKSFKNADVVISVSEKFYPVLIKYGVIQSKLMTIHNGIDFSKKTINSYENCETIRKSLGFRCEDLLFVQVARLEEVKGHTYAFKALKKLITKGFTNVHLLLVGGGSLVTALKIECEKLKINEHIHFYEEQESVDIFYQIADTTLLTSLSESFPLVLLESALYEKPVIATNVGDIDHLIMNEQFGWLVQPCNPLQLAKAMEKAVLLKENGHLDLMGKKLHDYASKSFSLQKSIEKLYKVYRHVE